VERPRRPRGRHRAAARGRRRAEGGQRPPRHRDEPGPGGVPAPAERHDARPLATRPGWAATASCSRRALLTDPVRPALPQRLRAGAEGPQVAAHLGLADPGPPRGAPHQGRRDHHRPPGFGPGLGRRAWRWRSAVSAGCSTPRPSPARASSTTTCTCSPPTATCMEGVSAEASSLAGHQQLGNLTVVYDANQISIEDDTDISFSEDVAMRYEAYGWQVIDIDWRRCRTRPVAPTTPRTSTRCSPRSTRAEARAQAHPRRLHTIIAWPAPTQAEHGKSHGSALGADEIAATKEVLGFDPAKSFEVDETVLAHAREVKKRGKAAHAGRGTRPSPPGHGPPRARRPPRPARRGRAARGRREVPARLRGRRKGSRRARHPARSSAPSPRLPELWGGSADLAESNNTTMKGRALLHPRRARQTHEWKGGPYGRTLHFGIREHAMGMILNGIALQGLTRPYGGTFLCSPTTCGPRFASPRSSSSPSPSSGRTTRSASARTAPPTSRSSTSRLAAGHPGPGRGAPRRRQRDRPGMGRDPAPRRPLPASRSPARTCQSFDRTEHAKATGRRQGRLRAHRRGIRRPGRDPRRHRLRGAARRGRARLLLEKAEGATPRRLDAVPRVVRGAGSTAYREKVLPPAVRHRTRQCRGGGRHRGGATWSATPDGPSASSTSAPPPTTRPSSASSGSPPRPWSRRQSSQPRKAGQVPRDWHRGPARTPRPRRMSTTQEVSRPAPPCTAAGVSIWLDDLSRSASTSGNLQSSSTDATSSGVTTNPSIFQAAIVQGARLRRAGRASSRPPGDRRRGDLRDHDDQDVRDACDIFRRSTTPPAARRPRVDRGRPPASRTTPSGTIGRGQGAVGRGRPPERAHQDPRDHRGPAGHHRDPRRRASRSTSR
jgi:hypothetical protein